MNAKQLKRIMKPSEKKTAKVILDEYIENTDSVTIKYHFGKQKESHLKVPLEVWNDLTFSKEEDAIYITKYPGLTVITNDSGWRRLAVEGEDQDE